MLRFCLSMLSIEGFCLLDVSIGSGLFNLKFAGWIKIRKLYPKSLRLCEIVNVQAHPKADSLI